MWQHGSSTSSLQIPFVPVVHNAHCSPFKRDVLHLAYGAWLTAYGAWLTPAQLTRAQLCRGGHSLTIFQQLVTLPVVNTVNVGTHRYYPLCRGQRVLGSALARQPRIVAFLIWPYPNIPPR